MGAFGHSWVDVEWGFDWKFDSCVLFARLWPPPSLGWPKICLSKSFLFISLFKGFLCDDVDDVGQSILHVYKSVCLANSYDDIFLDAVVHDLI